MAGRRLPKRAKKCPDNRDVLRELRTLVVRKQISKTKLQMMVAAQVLKIRRYPDNQDVESMVAQFLKEMYRA